jgi:hypothetical protein
MGGPPLVISGSIGLHHALDDLQPVSDLWPVPVGPLTEPDAVVLAARLLLGIGVTPTPPVVADIVDETSAIPFYIQAVVDRMRSRPGVAVAAIVTECLAENVWQTDHYVSRLTTYYGDEGAARARAVLDIVAVDGAPTAIDVIAARLATRNPDLNVSRDDLIALLDKLEKDHYLVREGNADRMSSPLLARIWRFHRRLDS